MTSKVSRAGAGKPRLLNSWLARQGRESKLIDCLGQGWANYVNGMSTKSDLVLMPSV